MPWILVQNTCIEFFKFEVGTSKRLVFFPWISNSSSSFALEVVFSVANFTKAWRSSNCRLVVAKKVGFAVRCRTFQVVNTKELFLCWRLMPLSTNRGWPTSWLRIRRLTSTPSRPATQISDVCFDSSLWPAIALRSGQRHSNWPFSSVPTLTMSNCTGTCKDHSFHRQKQTSRYSLFATHQVEKCNVTLHKTLQSMINAKLQGQGLNTAIKTGSSKLFKRCPTTYL